LRQLSIESDMIQAFICDICLQRLATRHDCFGETGKISHFCDECFRRSMPQEILQSEGEVRDAHCEYCGRQPCMGGTDFFALITGVQQSKYMCLPCSAEYRRFFHEQLSPKTFGLSQEEQVAAMQKWLEMADTHMRQWVLGK